MLPTSFDLRKIDQLQVWRQVLNMPLLEIGQKFCNPFRVDRRPGCRLYEWNGVIYLQDRASFMYHGKTCTGIAKMIGINNLDFKVVDRPITKLVKPDFRINYQSKPFAEIDKLYWEQYGIDLKQLQFEGIDAVHYFKTSRQEVEVFPSDLTYAINVEDRVKIYRPYNEFRFLADFTGKEIGGMTELVSEPIFTKSAKDYMVLCNLGYSSRYIHSESVKNPPIGKYLVDNDLPGKTYATYLNSIGCEAFVLPDGYPKDISDCVKSIGYDESRRVLQSVI